MVNSDLTFLFVLVLRLIALLLAELLASIQFAWRAPAAHRRNFGVGTLADAVVSSAPFVLKLKLIVKTNDIHIKVIGNDQAEAACLHAGADINLLVFHIPFVEDLSLDRTRGHDLQFGILEAFPPPRLVLVGKVDDTAAEAQASRSASLLDEVIVHRDSRPRGSVMGRCADN